MTTEEKVANLMLAGASNQEIAYDLGIAVRTVKAHCAHLYAKAGLIDGKRKRIRWFNAVSAPKQSVPSPVRLSPRQRQLCGLVSRGLTNQQIAQEMGIALETVKNYMVVLFDEVGVFSRAELALWTREHVLEAA